ncbi:MAG: dipeptidase [Bacteroidota bacterium]
MSTLLALPCVLLLACVAVACAEPSAEATAVENPAGDSEPAPDFAGESVPATTAMSDGGAIAMPQEEVDRLVAEDSLWAEALRIHYDALVVDGHIDTPTLMVDQRYAFGERHARHHVDRPRMIEGGLDAAFFSVYVARQFGEGQAATDRALRLLDEIDRQLATLDGADVATTAAEVRAIRQRGGTAILLGLEGGHALQGSPEVLRQLAQRGVRYVTLTHLNTNSWADASTDVARWGGLNDLGRDLVAEMNRLGVLADLSHVSDSTFYDALDVTTAPVVLSHSSCRALFDHRRNVSDEMLRAVAANGGILMVNFYPDYIGSGRTSVETVLDHIDHAVQVAGVDHVGLGSDFDGVPRLPVGLGDVTRLPYLTHGLLARGYAEADIRKILGGNVLRVLDDAARESARLQQEERQRAAPPS